MSLRVRADEWLLDLAFALRERLGLAPSTEIRDSLKMCRRGRPIAAMTALEPPYVLSEVATAKDPPVHWVETLCAAGLHATPATWRNEYVAHTTIAVYVVTVDGRVVASCGLRHIAGVEHSAGVVNWVAVCPKHRGRKLASVVTKAALSAAEDRGLTQVFLAVDDFRLAAIQTYLGLGFQPCLNSWDRSHHWRWKKIEKRLGRRFDYCRERSHEAAVARLGNAPA